MVGEVLRRWIYDAARATRVIEGFVDDLSNWYIRRNRRRFWKGEMVPTSRGVRDPARGGPRQPAARAFVPHLADALWGNLVVAVDPAASDSVHLTDFPSSRPAGGCCRR